MKVGLALGSGGAKGLAHIAYLEVLDQLMIKTSGIAGSSIGSLIGSLYAGGMTMRELAEHYGCSVNAVSCAMKRLGIKARPSGRRSSA